MAGDGAVTSSIRWPFERTRGRGNGHDGRRGRGPSWRAHIDPPGNLDEVSLPGDWLFKFVGGSSECFAQRGKRESGAIHGAFAIRIDFLFEGKPFGATMFAASGEDGWPVD